MPIGDSYTLSLTAPPPHLTRLPRLTRVLVVGATSRPAEMSFGTFKFGVTNNSSSTIHTLARLIRVLELPSSSSNDALTSNSP
jgi:hypothetical protein